MKRIRFQAGFRDYRHDEIEGNCEIATSFKKKLAEGNSTSARSPLGPLTGSFGLRAEYRDCSAFGEEAPALPTIQRTLSGVFNEELGYRHVSFQFGARLDHTSLDPDDAAIERLDLPRRISRTRLCVARRARPPSRRPYAGAELGPGEAMSVGEQSRVYGAETPTDGYTVLNFHGSYQTTGTTVHTVTLRVDNAADDLHRNHLSYIGDLAPESLKLVHGIRF